MPPKTKFARLLTEYLEDARLSQEGLSRLTERDPRMDRIAQQQISRWATEEIPTPESVNRLAIALASALQEAGFDEVDDRAIYKKLMNARRDKVVARDVSPEAAHLDGLLVVLPKWARNIAWATLNAAASAFVKQYGDEREQSRRNNAPQSNSDNQP